MKLHSSIVWFSAGAICMLTLTTAFDYWNNPCKPGSENGTECIDFTTDELLQAELAVSAALDNRNPASSQEQENIKSARVHIQDSLHSFEKAMVELVK